MATHDTPTYVRQMPTESQQDYWVMCEVCGLHVIDTQLHDEWHAEQEKDLGEVGLSLLTLQAAVRRLER